MHAELPRFTGSVQHALDDKGRLIVPARFRERLGARFVLTIAHPDPCLALYPSATWANSAAGSRRARARTSATGASCAISLLTPRRSACDDQGRVVVPALLREYAGIEREVVSVGSLTRVEIWAKERYAISRGPPRARSPGFMADLGL